MRKIKIVLGLVLLLAMLWFGFWQNSQPGNSISQVQNVKPAKVETKQSTNQIPQAAITTWIYIQQHHQAPENYVGGREFKIANGNYHFVMKKELNLFIVNGIFIQKEKGLIEVPNVW